MDLVTGLDQENSELLAEVEKVRAENARLRAELDAARRPFGQWQPRQHRGQPFVASVLSTLIRATSEDMDAALYKVLSDTGAFINADQLYLFDISPDQQQLRCKYVWRDDGASSDGTAEDLSLAVPVDMLPGLNTGPDSGARTIADVAAEGTKPGNSWSDLWLNRGIRALVGVPLLCQGTPVGALVAAALTKPRIWPEETVDLLEQLGDIFAQALVRQRTESVQSRHLRTLEDMARVHAAMEGCRDLDEVQDAATSTICDIFGCDRVLLLQLGGQDNSTVRIVSEQTATPCIPSVAGVAITDDAGNIVTEPCLTAALAATLSAQEPVTCAAAGPRPLSRLSTHLGVQSEMWLALRVRIGQPWILVLQHVREARVWAQHDHRLAADAGRRVASAIGTFLSFRNLKANEERFRSLLAAIPDMVFVVDAVGRYRDIFALQYQKLVRDPSELIGKTVREVLPQNVANAITRSIDRSIRTRELQHLEYALDIPEGKRWFSARISPINVGDDPCAISVISDITERRNLEEQLLQAQKMESVGRLAGGVAHDFNNLLTAVLSHAELAMEELSEDTEVRQDLKLIRDAAARGATLTRQLLTFARKQVISPQVVNLNDLLFRVDAILRRLIGAHIELVTVPEPSLYPVKIDPVQFEQVLVNLAINARDAMPNGGKLILETSNMELDIESLATYPDLEPGPYVVLSVTDTGVGMNEDTLSHVFEPFFTTKETGKGTGLGLATCYGVIKQCGGDLWVSSTLGVGTTFKVVLPRVLGSIDEIHKDDEGGPLRSGTETILLVEDEPTVRAVAVRTLRRYGYRVIEAANGDEALATSPEQLARIDLLLTDVVMPRMSGRQLAEQMRPRCRPDMRVLYVSGYTADAIAPHAIQGKGVTFLQKPFTPVLLARKVRELLDTPADEPSDAESSQSD